MTERECFLAAILAEPDDDTARLVFADWLDEHGEAERAHAMRHGVVKRFGRDFNSPGGALTLDASDVTEVAHTSAGRHTRTHPDGWTIAGEVHEDYFVWVNDFEASHPEHGLVWGDFEDVVFATSEAGYRHFWQHHAPSAWDYHDV